tara:strand:- start:1627 stop:2061 length:435 start_codon:yes stop_codon:yes gene_type:complete
MQSPRNIPVVVGPAGRLPTRGSDQAAGHDLYAAHGAWLFPLVPRRIALDVAIALPESTMGSIRDRSGLASRGLHVLGGVIDADYRGPMAVILVNLSWIPRRVRAGDRIAQLVIPQLIDSRRGLVSRLSLDETPRGVGGFGSTGR